MAPILGIWASSKSTVAADTGAMFPLQVITVGSAGAANVEFTNIPNTYTHLQVRTFVRSNRSTYNNDVMNLQLNGDTTASNYANHNIRSNGANSAASAIANGNTSAFGELIIGANNGAAPFAGFVIDILDYANTNKYKVYRAIGGADSNGDVAGFCAVPMLLSQLWLNTNAITSIKFVPVYGTSFNQYSSFALYGIKGA